MTVRLRAADGKIVIWEGAANIAPFNDPESHLDVVKFSSTLRYPRVIDERAFSVSLPARNLGLGAASRITQSYTLFAHGRPGIPWILGSALVDGVEVAFTGSVPFQQNPANYQWSRFLTIGADATNVYLYEYGVWSGGASAAAASLAVKIWVTDKVLG